jgi:hypothetical protein
VVRSSSNMLLFCSCCNLLHRCGLRTQQSQWF